MLANVPPRSVGVNRLSNEIAALLIHTTLAAVPVSSPLSNCENPNPLRRNTLPARVSDQNSAVKAFSLAIFHPSTPYWHFIFSIPVTSLAG